MAAIDGEPGKRAHPYRPLTGTALTDHLMAEHGWDQRMVTIRAQHNPLWAQNMHEWDHDPDVPA